MSDSRERPIETVFCAFDFSETAELAEQHALRFVRRHGARLVLAHVVEPLPPAPYPRLTTPRDERTIVEIARERMEERAEALRAQGLTVEVCVEEGKPGPKLVAAARARAADLVVIGTRGMTGFKRLLLGSTAEHVVRRSAIPVLTVHPSPTAIKEVLETVLLPTDLSEETADAAKAFMALAGGKDQPRVILAYADRTPPYLEPYRHEVLLKTHARDVVKEEIERQMQPLAAILREGGLLVETAVVDGEPVSAMTDLAEERNVDMIVMSTHGRSALLNTLLGRTVERIVQHASCPVLTVRPGSRSGLAD